MYDVIPRNAYTFPTSYVTVKYTRTQIITHYVTCNTVRQLVVGYSFLCPIYYRVQYLYGKVSYEMCMCTVLGHPVCAHHVNASSIVSMSIV